jgi:thiol-disulfide isomerase/thioredoxin
MGFPSMTFAMGNYTRAVIPGRRNAWFAAIHLLAGAAMMALAGGCTPLDAGKTLTPIPDWAAFQEMVLKSKRPVLVELSKDPCPPCVAQKAELDKLTDEFGDRILFASMTMVKGDFIVLCPEIRDRYHVFWLPTTILFVNGEERKRWENLHGATEIREELKKVLLDSIARPGLGGTGSIPK